MADEEFTPEELELLDEMIADLKALNRRLSNRFSSGEKNSIVEPVLIDLPQIQPIPSEIESTRVMEQTEDQIEDPVDDSLDLVKTKWAVQVTYSLNNGGLGTVLRDRLLQPFVPITQQTKCTSSNFVPGVFISNRLLDLYTKCGSLVDAQKVFDEMGNRDLCPHWVSMTGWDSIEIILAQTDALQIMFLTPFTPRLPPKPPDFSYYIMGFAESNHSSFKENQSLYSQPVVAVDTGKELMHAVWYNGYGGGPSGLKHVDVLIKLEVASINPIDWEMQKRMMWPLVPLKFPYIPGTEVAGEVLEVGDGVYKFKPGDKVVGGRLAEFAVVKENITASRPLEIPAFQCADLPVVGFTLLQALTQSIGIKIDESGKWTNMLATTASDGVGHYAVQLAKLGHTHVIATCGAHNIELVQGLGADAVIDYMTLDGVVLTRPSGKKYDVVVHCAEGIPWSTFEPNLNMNGKVVDITPTSSSMMTTALKKLTCSKKQLVPLLLSPKGKNLQFLVDLVKDGKLITVICFKYHLSKVKEGWARSSVGHSVVVFNLRLKHYSVSYFIELDMCCMLDLDENEQGLIWPSVSGKDSYNGLVISPTGFNFKPYSLFVKLIAVRISFARWPKMKRRKCRRLNMSSTTFWIINYIRKFFRFVPKVYVIGLMHGNFNYISLVNGGAQPLESQIFVGIVAVCSPNELDHSSYCGTSFLIWLVSRIILFTIKNLEHMVVLINDIIRYTVKHIIFANFSSAKFGITDAAISVLPLFNIALSSTVHAPIRTNFFHFLLAILLIVMKSLCYSWILILCLVRLNKASNQHKIYGAEKFDDVKGFHQDMKKLIGLQRDDALEYAANLHNASINTIRAMASIQAANSRLEISHRTYYKLSSSVEQGSSSCSLKMMLSFELSSEFSKLKEDMIIATAI